jgi:hypothetical protein
MNNNPLEQLRDIRLPAEPDLWPPALGWWLLAAMIITAVIMLSRIGLNAYRSRRPIRTAKKLIEQLFRQHDEGSLSDLGLVHQSNAVLKRLLVVALEIRHVGETSDRQWLLALDQISSTSDFSKGPGAILGMQRFNPAAKVDISTFKPLLLKVIADTHPEKTRTALTRYFSSQPEDKHSADLKPDIAPKTTLEKPI